MPYQTGIINANVTKKIKFNNKYRKGKERKKAENTEQIRILCYKYKEPLTTLFLGKITFSKCFSRLYS